eukprot:364162-Chlamydomonas_euryale.AAC.4
MQDRLGHLLPYLHQLLHIQLATLFRQQAHQLLGDVLAAHGAAAGAPAPACRPAAAADLAAAANIALLQQQQKCARGELACRCGARRRGMAHARAARAGVAGV